MADEQIIFTEKVRHPSSTSTASIWVDMREVYEDSTSTKHRDLESLTPTSAGIDVAQSDVWKNYSNNIDTLVWPNETISYIDDNYNKDNPAIDITGINFTSTSSTKLSNITYDYLGATVAVSENNDIQIQSVASTTPFSDIFNYNFSVPTGATISNPLHIFPDTIEDYNNNINIFSRGDNGLYGKVGTTDIHGFSFVEKINNQEVSYYEQNEHPTIDIEQKPVVFWDNQNITLNSIIQLSWEQIDLNNLSGSQENYIIINDEYEAYYDTDLRDEEAIRLTYNDYFGVDEDEAPLEYITVNNKNVPYFTIYPYDDQTNLINVFINPDDGLVYLIDQVTTHPDHKTYYLHSDYNYFYHFETDYVGGRLREGNIEPITALIPNYSFTSMNVYDIENMRLNQFAINSEEIHSLTIHNQQYNYFYVTPTQPVLLAGTCFINKNNSDFYFQVDSIEQLIFLSNLYSGSTSWAWRGDITVSLSNAKEIYTKNVNGWYIGSFDDFGFNDNNIELLPINETNILNKYNIDIQDNIFRYKNIETDYRIAVSYAELNEKTHMSMSLWENDNFLTAYEYDTASLTRDKLWILNNTPLIWETAEENARYFIKEEDFNFNKQFINFIKKVYGRYTINYNFGLTYGFDQYTFIPEQKIRYYSGDNQVSGKAKLLNVGSSSIPVYIENGEFKPLDNFDVSDNIDFELLDGSEDNQNNIDTYGEFDENMRELTIRFDDVTMINELQEIAFNTQNAASNVLRIIDVPEEGEGD